jgi:hypothetical protein
MRRPELVVSADWSNDESKRWMARAELRPDGATYRVYPPEPVGEVGSLVDRLRAQLPRGGTLLLGFDFPIGLPRAYVANANLLQAGFRTALGLFGQQEPWQSFYDVSDSPDVYRPFYPPPTQTKGLYSKAALRRALGVEKDRELLRLCDRSTSTRPAAECMFFTLGGKQVGPALIAAWNNVLAPKRNQLRLWPFDGDLGPLLAEPGVVVVELYPGEAYSHLGLKNGLGKGLSKRRRKDRRADVVRDALLGQKNEDVELTNAAISWVDWGFLGEDDFDATVALFSMLQVVTGRRPDGVPDEPAVRSAEGWILGQCYPGCE